MSGVIVSLAGLNDCLLVVHSTRSFSTDLWFLVDMEKGLWVKKHTIQFDPGTHHDYKFRVRPLLMLNDGRILMCCGSGFISIYDPRTRACKHLEGIRPYAGLAGLYTGSLLRLPNVSR